MRSRLLDASRRWITLLLRFYPIDFREELPRHPTGKLYKRLLKDEYWAGHESRII